MLVLIAAAITAWANAALTRASPSLGTTRDRVGFQARFGLLIIDEFGLDRNERSLCPQAASLWYKVFDAPANG